jgi:intein/homing endonuclease
MPQISIQYSKAQEVELREVKPGDLILVPDGFTEVKDNNSIEKECIEIELDDGTIFTGTLDHKIMTDKGWIELKDLTEEHEILSFNTISLESVGKSVDIKDAKRCVSCSVSSTSKRYSGPKCRKCYRSSLRNQKKKGVVDA